MDFFEMERIRNGRGNPRVKRIMYMIIIIPSILVLTVIICSFVELYSVWNPTAAPVSIAPGATNTSYDNRNSSSWFTGHP